MIAQELEVSLHMAFVEARQARHEFITVEHLLLALLDNPSAAEVMRACAVNIDDLRKTLTNFISDNTPTVPGTTEVDTQPGQQPTADKGADDAKSNVSYETEAGASHDLSGKPSGSKTDQ